MPVTAAQIKEMASRTAVDGVRERPELYLKAARLDPEVLARLLNHVEE